MRRIYFVFPFLVAAVFLIAGTASSRSANRTHVGTLTCTVAPSTQPQAFESRELSCVFEPVSGMKGTFGGTVNRLGGTAPTADQIVLVWSVFAEEPNVSMHQLEGRYVGVISNGSGELSSGEVALQPMSALPGGTQNLAPLVLELDLKMLKA